MTSSPRYLSLLAHVSCWTDLDDRQPPKCSLRCVCRKQRRELAHLTQAGDFNRLLFCQVMHAVTELHSRGIAHRDLKPENLLLANPGDPASIKIADFGFAKIMSKLPKVHGQQLMKTSCGTPEYVAPEVLQNVGYDCKCDVWSMGVILYIMLCGFPPFCA